MNPIIKQWDTAKSLKSTNQYKEALAIYESLYPKVERELSDNFDKAMFFGDYFGVLADVAQYDKAEAMAAKALKYITENGYTTLTISSIIMGICIFIKLNGKKLFLGSKKRSTEIAMGGLMKNEKPTMALL